jgi:hypothetical protein
MVTAGRLAASSVLVAVGAPVAYALLLRIPVVRNHPEGYDFQVRPDPDDVLRAVRALP